MKYDTRSLVEVEFLFVLLHIVLVTLLKVLGEDDVAVLSNGMHSRLVKSVREGRGGEGVSISKSAQLAGQVHLEAKHVDLYWHTRAGGAHACPILSTYIVYMCVHSVCVDDCTHNYSLLGECNSLCRL